MHATKTWQCDRDTNLSMSQAYVPLIHKFAPEIQQEIDIKEKNWEILSERSKSCANINCQVDLPSVTYSICVVWWWNLWLSAFLQWKRALKHMNVCPTYSAVAAGVVKLGRIDSAYKGVVQTTHHWHPPPPFILIQTLHSLFITGRFAINSMQKI